MAFELVKKWEPLDKEWYYEVRGYRGAVLAVKRDFRTRKDAESFLKAFPTERIPKESRDTIAS